MEKSAGLKAWQRWWVFRDVHRFFGLKFWAFVCGGAALSPSGEQFWSRLGFVVIQGYGMTETTALVSLNHPFHAAQGTIGQVLPGREVKLSDDGEVLVRGETISNTTWQHGAMQRQESEWLATGDLAEFDAQGNLHFKGRKKDVIVTASGLNIYPEDLEGALSAQAGVKAVAVIETDAGNGPEAAGRSGDAARRAGGDAVEAANRALADFQQIRRWRVWPEPDFPRTSTGKILKREVVRRLAASQEPPQAGELNLDSLGRVQLQAQLEQQYGIALDDTALQSVNTQADVQRLITQASASPAKTAAPPHRYWHWVWNPLTQGLRALFLELVAMPSDAFSSETESPAASDALAEAPALIVCNHLTSYDAPFILYALPGRNSAAGGHCDGGRDASRSIEKAATREAGISTFFRRSPIGSSPPCSTFFRCRNTAASGAVFNMPAKRWIAATTCLSSRKAIALTMGNRSPSSLVPDCFGRTWALRRSPCASTAWAT